jgi:MtfA peptidase
VRATIRAWLRSWQCAWRALRRGNPAAGSDIPEPLWLQTIEALPCLHRLEAPQRERLRSLCEVFLVRKEFHGAQGLAITDDMALAIAAQACLPLLHWGPKALRCYDDFVLIVVHPGEVVAPREATDAAGVVHRWKEPLIGEAMHRGPVMLAWSHVRGGPQEQARGHNLVIHEFAHKLELHGKDADAAPDGCPQLPAGFMGHRSGQAARAAWRDALMGAYARFHGQVEMARRFGAPPPWMDTYGAEAPEEFFAVCCEAYFVDRDRWGQDFPDLLPLFDAYFCPPGE